MKILRKINENGFFVEDVLGDTQSELLLDTEPAQGFFKPKWDGSQWIEGASQEQIDSITALAEANYIPTEQEQIDELVTALVERGVLF